MVLDRAGGDVNLRPPVGALVVQTKEMRNGCYVIPATTQFSPQMFFLTARHFPAVVMDEGTKVGERSLVRLLLATGEVVGVTTVCLLFSLKRVDLNGSPSEGA